MIVTKKKPLEEIAESLRGYKKIFLIGCGECATSCKTGGDPEVAAIKAELEKLGKVITGSCIPEAPCVAAKLKSELARHIKPLREAEAVLILACGLGVQSVKDNDRIGLGALPACDTICAAVCDGKGDFYEKCSMCAECLLAVTGGICPVTLCPKGLLNGPCGGVDKGRCEVDRERDCAWVLIYKELAKQGRIKNIAAIQPARNFKKTSKPYKSGPH